MEPDPSFKASKDYFIKDGERLFIKSGSLHYFRVPEQYWRNRLRMMRKACLNSVATCVEWSYHEPEERQYSFKGDRDLAQFVRTAADEQLFVLLQAGPYIGADRDMGGLPYWLIGKYPDIELRSTDKDFMSEASIWLNKLFEQITPLLYGNGGPIILVQVENEYGSFGSDEAYKEQLRDLFLEHVGDKAVLYTMDEPDAIKNGKIKGTVTTVTCGPDHDVIRIFRDYSKDLEGSPRMISAYHIGSMTHWSNRHMKPGSTYESISDEIDNCRVWDINVNIYMFVGGTNFEFYAGASNHRGYIPQVTSYEFNAPISESGDLSPKYRAVCNALKYKTNSRHRYRCPKVFIHKLDVGKVTVTPCINILSQKGRTSLGIKYPDVTGSTLPYFETLRQRAGLMLYETTLEDANGVLYIDQTERDPTPDRVYVYVDGEYNGIISRLRHYSILSLELKAKKGSTLSLLVENQGRICYGHNWQIKDFKGLRQVNYNEKPLSGKWIITGYPLQTVNIACTSPFGEVLPLDGNLKNGPILFNGTFTLEEGQKADTYFNPKGWRKGLVWVNGHNLGRYWPRMGPQVTLYVPGVWLEDPPASNQVRILELETAPQNLSVEFIDHPIRHQQWQ